MAKVKRERGTERNRELYNAKQKKTDKSIEEYHNRHYRIYNRI